MTIMEHRNMHLLASRLGFEYEPVGQLDGASVCVGLFIHDEAMYPERFNYIKVYRQTDRDRDRQTDRQTDRCGAGVSWGCRWILLSVCLEKNRMLRQNTEVLRRLLQEDPVRTQTSCQR